MMVGRGTTKRIDHNTELIVGQRVRQLRMQLGMTQEALAKEVGVSFQQIQKYEKGTNRISVSRMLEFADILQTTPNDIIGWKGPTDGKVINSFDVSLFNAARDFAVLPEDLRIIVRRMVEVLLDATKKKR